MLFFYRCAVHRDLPSFPTRRSSDLDEPEVRRLIQLYHSIDTASVVAEVVRIVDTLLFRPAEGLRLLDATLERRRFPVDRKSTRLNSSHTVISYAVFCLKKKKRGYYY